MTMDDYCESERTLCVDGKTFAEQYSQAVLANKKADFVALYSNLDELFVSDIECWAGKQKVQEEFLKISQILLKKNKLICLEPACELDESAGFDQELKTLVKNV